MNFRIPDNAQNRANLNSSLSAGQFNLHFAGDFNQPRPLQVSFRNLLERTNFQPLSTLFYGNYPLPSIEKVVGEPQGNPDPMEWMIKIWKGLELNYEEISRRLDSSEPPLAEILSEILQNDWKSWQISDSEDPLYGTFLQFFWKNLISEDWGDISKFSLAQHRNGQYFFQAATFEEYGQYNNPDNVANQLHSFLQGDILSSGRVNLPENNANLRHAFQNIAVHNDYNLGNLGHHRIISFKIFNFFLIFFYKILTISFFIRNSKSAISLQTDVANRFPLPPKLTNEYLRTLTSPNGLYMKFYPLFLHFFQTMNFWLYKTILKNNFFHSRVGLSIPREMGALRYQIFNNIAQRGSFLLDSNDNTNSKSWSNNNLIDDIGNGVNLFRVRGPANRFILPNIRLFNENLLQIFRDFFKSIHKIPHALGNVSNFQVIFTYYLLLDSAQAGAANNFTSSIQITFGDLLGGFNNDFNDWFSKIILLIFAEIETWLLDRLFRYNPFPEDDEEQSEELIEIQRLRRDRVEATTRGRQYSFFPNAASLESFYSNIAIIGFRYISLNAQDHDIIAGTLQSFHREEDDYFNSWIDVYLPPINTHCLSGILFYFITTFHPKGNDLLHISEISLWIQKNLGRKKLQMWSKIISCSSVKSFLKFANNEILFHCNKCLNIYVFHGHAILKPPKNGHFSKIWCLLYNSHIGVISEERKEILMNYRDMQKWVSLPLFTYAKRRLLLGMKEELAYKIFLGKKKSVLNKKKWNFFPHFLGSDAKNEIQRLRENYIPKNISNSVEGELYNSLDNFSTKSKKKEEKNIRSKFGNDLKLNPPDDFLRFNLLWKLFRKYSYNVHNRETFSKLQGEFILQQGYYSRKKFNTLKPWKPYIVTNKKIKKSRKKIIVNDYLGEEEEIKEEEKKLDQMAAKIKKFEEIIVIGWDVETVLVPSSMKNGIKKYSCYCICTYSIHSEYNLYFWGEDSVLQFTAWLSEMIWSPKAKGHKVYLYSFNGARFDNSFIFLQLLKQFYGKIEYIGNLQNIKAIIIMGRVYFYDLRLILTRGSLKDLALSLLKTETKIPFNIMDFVDDKQKFEDHKDEIIKYCFQDSRLVYLLVQSLHEFFTRFLYDIGYSNNSFSIFQPTLSLLALTLWKRLTTNTFAILQGVSSSEHYEQIKSSYKGGMCLNIRKFCKGPIFHYDIVSSYPNIMRNYKMPIKISTIKNYNPVLQKPPKGNRFDEYSIFRTRFTFISSLHIPYFPLKSKQGGLIYPQSNFLDEESTWIWGGELNFALQNNHLESLQVDSSISFENKSIFSEYINILFEERLKAIAAKDEIKKYWLKLLMNSLYGKFGQKKFDNISIITGKNLHEFMIGKDLITEEEEEKGDISKKKIKIKETEEFLKRIQILDDNLMDEPFFQFSFMSSEKFNYVGSLIFISSYIASRARICLLRGMNDVGFNNVLYFDTDSIFSTNSISSSFQGDSLGDWKCEEDNIEEAYFLAPKVYACRLPNSKYILHCKGIPEKLLKWEDFEKMYKEDHFSYKNIGQLKHEKGEIYYFDNLIKELRFLNNKRKFQGDESKPWKSRQEMDKIFQEY